MEFKIVVKAMVLRNNHLLTVRRSKQDKINPGKVSVPAGFLEFGEKPRDAVKREVKEETGLEVDVGRVTSVWTQIIPEQSIQIVGINFLCYPLTERIKLNTELDSCEWVDLKKYEQYNLPSELLKEIEFFKNENII